MDSFCYRLWCWCRVRLSLAELFASLWWFVADALLIITSDVLVMGQAVTTKRLFLISTSYVVSCSIVQYLHVEYNDRCMSAGGKLHHSWMLLSAVGRTRALPAQMRYPPRTLKSKSVQVLRCSLLLLTAVASSEAWWSKRAVLAAVRALKKLLDGYDSALMRTACGIVLNFPVSDQFRQFVLGPEQMQSNTGS